MGLSFWEFPITRYPCEIHGSLVVWRVTPSYVSPRVEFTFRYCSHGTLIYKYNAIYPDSPARSTLMSGAAPHALDFDFVEDFYDWRSTQFACHF